MTRALAVVVAGILLLSGCSPYAPLPEPLTPAEAEAIYSQERTLYWSHIGGGEPVPVVEPMGVAGPETSGLVDECVLALELEGVVESGGAFVLDAGGDRSQFERAMFICNAAYPPDFTDPEALGYLSDAEQQYLWRYFTTYLVPCMRMHGYTVPNPPAYDMFMTGPYLNWIPYSVMRAPADRTFRWKQLDADCAPPPIGQTWRPAP